MARIDLVALQQRLAQQQPTPVQAEVPVVKHTASASFSLRTTPPPKAAASAATPAGTLRATTTMRAALPLKATRAERAEERARTNALRAQLDELNAELMVVRAEADRALAEERQRIDRLNQQVEALSAEVVRAEKQAEAVVTRAEWAEAGRDAEHARADELRDRIEVMAADLAAARGAENRARAETDLLARKVNELTKANDARRATGRWAQVGVAWRINGRSSEPISGKSARTTPAGTTDQCLALCR